MVVVSTAKCIWSAYSAYIGVGNVVPSMTAAKAKASSGKARRRRVLTRVNNAAAAMGNPYPI